MQIYASRDLYRQEYSALDVAMSCFVDHLMVGELGFNLLVE
jgi:hypothetical protein